MRIQHNIPALNTYRQLSTNNTGTAKALEKLSSGFRINRAGDDAAGLAISEKMRAQTRGLDRASSNAQDGISLIQSAEGALQETHSILQRMRELSVQAANDVNEAEDRQAIQDEINQLTKEVDRIAFTTEFNKKTLLDGSLTGSKYARPVSGGNVSGVSITPASDPSTAPIVNGLTAIAVTTAGEKYNMTFDFAFDPAQTGQTNGVITEVGASGTIDIKLSDDILLAAGITTDEYKVAVNVGDTAEIIAGNVRDILSKALGSDFNVTANGSKLSIENKYVGNFGGGVTIGATNVDTVLNANYTTGQGNEGVDLQIQVDGDDATFLNSNFTSWADNAPNTGALKGKDTTLELLLGDGTGSTTNAQFSFKIDDATKLSSSIVSIADGKDLTLQVGANTGESQTIGLAIRSLSSKSLGISELNLSDHRSSQNAVAAVENAIQSVSTQRAALGAVQNRLEHTIANLDTVSENLSAAESRIRDTDMAKEMMNFTKMNILNQAAQSMLAQANSQPQGVLQLLR